MLSALETIALDFYFQGDEYVRAIACETDVWVSYEDPQGYVYDVTNLARVVSNDLQAFHHLVEEHFHFTPTLIGVSNEYTNF